jgi:predicted ester cyclase
LALFSNVRVTVEVGTVIDEDKVVNRWVFCGTYQGDIPGAAPIAHGKQIVFRGIDILRVEDGKIVEYWVSSDGLHLMQQLGVILS